MLSYLLHSHWPDPSWRRLRIASFVTTATTLVVLTIVLLGAGSWKIPLAMAVVANICVFAAVLLRGGELYLRKRSARAGDGEI